MPQSSHPGRLYTYGICRWVSEHRNNAEHYLMSFDLSNDVFFITYIPLAIPTNIDPDFDFDFVQARLVLKKQIRI